MVSVSAIQLGSQSRISRKSSTWVWPRRSIVKLDHHTYFQVPATYYTVQITPAVVLVPGIESGVEPGTLQFVSEGATNCATDYLPFTICFLVFDH